MEDDGIDQSPNYTLLQLFQLQVVIHPVSNKKENNNQQELSTAVKYYSLKGKNKPWDISMYFLNVSISAYNNQMMQFHSEWCL